MTQIKKLLSCLSLIAGLSSFSSAYASPLQEATLRIDWTALGYHAPFYLGVAKHFYQDQGIDLVIQETRGSPAVVNLVGNGSSTFGFADASTAAQLISQGVPVKAVMGIFRKSTLALFFPTGRGIKTPADLHGKRIILCPTDGMIKYLPVFLKAHNMDMTDVKVVSVDCALKYTYLAQGNGDVVGSYGTAGGPLLRAVGVQNYGKFDYADSGISLPAHGIIVSTKMLQTEGDEVKRFVAATQKAWEYSRQHPNEAVAAMVSAKPLLQGKEQALEATLKDSLQYLSTPTTKGKPIGWQSPEQWQAATTLLTTAAGMKRPASPTLFYTNEFVGAL